MHVASFDKGSSAACQTFANELLDLYLNPIIDDLGKSWIVVVGQVIFDDKGRESFIGVQGGTSLAGCNICHFPGRSFSKSLRVFDGFRRYCLRNDQYRKKSSNKNRTHSLQFPFDEKGSKPKKRNYEQYVQYANEKKQSESTNNPLKHVHGVKDL